VVLHGTVVWMGWMDVCFLFYILYIWYPGYGLLFLMVAGHPKIFSAYGTTGSLI
jgi:hypothetical protein